MRTLLTLAVLLGGMLAAVPARAVEGKIIDNPDLTMTAGYKLWVNSWSSWNGGSGGNNFVQTSANGVANMFPFSHKYKNVFTSLNFMFTPEYTFATYTDRTNAGALTSVQLKAKRDEVDWNVGVMVVPELGFTAGIKSVHQRWIGATSSTDYNYLGPTLGILGAAPIGNGFALYGNGVGGFMGLKITPDTNSAANHTAAYESAELGLAWKAPRAPLSASFGYKFQRINTKLDSPSVGDLRALDLTSGYTMGVNVIF